MDQVSRKKRSRADASSKSLAVLQTTQCLARGVYGLAVTELEVATLAFAALNGVLYFLWRDKPLGVASVEKLERKS